MAHNLNFNQHTGRYSFFSVKEKAWHSLGQIVDQYPTSAEAIKHGGLNFEVNCTLRQRSSRLTRLALSFSKSLDNHIGAIKYFICHYNQMCKTLHL